jgi:hypothetical protein
VAAKVGWGFFSASSGGSHTKAARQSTIELYLMSNKYKLLRRTKSSEAMTFMANLEVEISMDCMVVEIDRPWLHAELFSDAELDSGRYVYQDISMALKPI